ncbi:MAG: regulatory iron-sulfur-containing complex subunit RicT [Mycobacterium leprae]
MVRVVGVRFKPAGKVYYFDPSELEIPAGSCVVVETARGVEYGEVAVGTRDVTEEQIVEPLKKVLRLGSDKDATVAADNRRKEQEAFSVAQKKIEAHGLEMSLVDVEYTFDGSKVIFYFTAEGRIDFRELVRDLAGIFRTRIEMRQIGVRDEAKLLGGIGPCGRILCCTSFLGDFAPVSIRMAKDQNLSLNPSKISGLCGRLMCCLRYEQDTYEAAKKDPTLAPGYVPPVLLVEGDQDGDLVALEDRPARRPSMPQSRPVEEAAVAFSARIAQAAGLAGERPTSREERPVPASAEGRSANREALPEQRQRPKRSPGAGGQQQPRRDAEAGRQSTDGPKRTGEAPARGGGRPQRQQQPKREAPAAEQQGEQQLTLLPGEKLNGQRFQGVRGTAEGVPGERAERPRRDRHHDRRRGQGERPQGERPQGERPQGERPQSQRAPQAEHQQGEQQAPGTRPEGGGDRRRRHHRGRRRSGGGDRGAGEGAQGPTPPPERNPQP